MSLGKILLVSHNFPPTAGPESHLVRMNAAYLQRQGWDIRIVTTTSIHLKQQMDHSLLAGFSVDRVTSPDAALAERFPKLGKFALGWLGTNVLPEVYLSWQFPATKVGMRVLKQWKPDIIYSRATKHVSNVVGWQLKARTGLPWVAHFSDPWICGGMRMRPLQKMIGRFWERRILRDADAVVFVSDQAAQRVM
jgi:hypothetical protein